MVFSVGLPRRVDVRGRAAARVVGVPEALFLSRSKFGTFFLRLQQGRMPGVDDDVSNWGNVLHQLRRDYGSQHEGDESRNGIFIQDGRGKEYLVAIDLEESNFVT
jgi:hypothetical protein